MGSLLAALATILVTGLAALLALPYVVDWNDYKTQFETHAAQLVGRPVRIEGNVDLTFLPVPAISVRGVRIADEFGKFDRPFAEVEELNAILSIPPLLSGTMEAKSIELDQPIVRLKIDEFGEGSWQSIGPHGLNIPVPIRKVVLNRVDIRDGAIELRRSEETSARRLDRITGAFSADGLSGPFRFSGTGAIGAARKEIQFGAGTLQADASIRLKGSVRSMDGVSLYQLDGELKGLDGPVHYVGPVAARIALDSEAKKAETAQISDPMAGRAIEMRASAKITFEDATFDGIAVTVTQNDRPQSLTGRAYASWGATPRLDLAVEASWLDFDQILRSAPGGERSTPSTAISALPAVFEGWFFKPRQGEITAKIQQAGFGGDIVERLNFAASHDSGGWRIRTLTARLPGETDVEVNGALPSGDALAFNGGFTLKGANLSRLLRWASPSLGVVEAGAAQNFSLSSQMALTPERLAFEEAKGSLGESSFSFDLVHDYGESSKLLLALDSERLDLRGLFNAGTAGLGGGQDPALASLEPSATTEGWTAETVSTRRTSLADVLWTVFKAEQSNVSLLISQLQLPDFEARDVRSAFRYEDGTFDIRELNLATTDGLKISADGRIKDLDSRPDGTLNLSIDAPSAQSVTNLARLGGIESVGSRASRRVDALAPFKLKGNLAAVARERLMTLTLAGSAAGSELSFTGRFTGDLESLQTARIDANGLIGNEDGRRLIAQLAPEVPLDKAVEQTGGGFLKVSVRGAMKDGLISRIELRTPQAQGQFEGRISPLEEPSWGFNGDLNLRADHAATALSMLRLSPGGVPVAGATELRASVSKAGPTYKIAGLSLKIGGETVRGAAEVDMAGDRPSARIDVNAASVSLPKIAAYLVDWERQDLTSQIASIASGASDIWPNQAFALASLQSADGALKLQSQTIALADGLSLQDGRLEASLQAGELKLTRLSGRVHGGAFSASGALKALQGRALFEAKIEAEQLDLASLSRAHGGNEMAKGRADLSLSLEGQGFSPRGLVSVLSGEGALKVGRGAIQGLSPSVLKSAASAYLTQEIPDKDRLNAKLDRDFRKGNLAIDAASFPVAVRDGVISVNDAVFKGDDYRADARLIVDLASLRLDSEWRVAYTGKTDDGQTIPPVQLVFAGPLAEFSALKSTLYADQFERFLTIKRMDQDMERLEKLNQQRGVSRGPAQPRPPARPDAASAVSAGTERRDAPDQTIPTQSLLRAPTVRLDDPQAPEPGGVPNPPGNAARPQPSPSGWSTGTETTAPAAEGRSWQAEPRPSAAPQPGDFESQIREVLRSQGANGSEARPQ